MIISRESRKSRKIIHRYRSYVAVRMANASEMMRFRVICEIRVRQKSCVKREYFYNAFSLVLTVGVDHVLVCRQKKAGVEKRISHILLLNLRDTYASYRNERQQPDNHLSDRGRTDTGGCPHGERHGVA